MSVFCTSKLFTPYHHCKIFWAYLLPLQHSSATTSFQFVSWWLQEQELLRQQQRQCQHLVRMKKGVSQQQEHVNGMNANQRRNEVKYGRPILWGHAEGRAFLSEERQSEIRQTNWTGHAEGHACLSTERRSEIRQTNWTRHVVEGRARLSSEEQHAENGAHHLNLLLLNHFFLILYLLSLITLQDKKLKDPVIFFHMPCTTAS